MRACLYGLAEMLQSQNGTEWIAFMIVPILSILPSILTVLPRVAVVYSPSGPTQPMHRYLPAWMDMRDVMSVPVEHEANLQGLV